jgi:hypothetical protein
MTRSNVSHTSSIVLRAPGAGPPESRLDGSAGALGRHAVLRPVRWHRRVLVAVIAGALAAGGSMIVMRTRAPVVCAPVQVVAAPEIAPLIGQVARQLGGCAVTTVARSAADEAEALAGGSVPPHIWLPESSAMLARARASGATAVPASGVSVAASPVIMAVTEDAAARLGPGRPSCEAVFTSDRVVLGAADPARDPVSLGALVEAQADLGQPPGAPLTALMRKLQGHLAATGADPSGPVTAFPTTEQKLMRHNATEPGSALTAAYPDEAPAWMDYPFTVLGSATAAERDTAAKLLAALRDPDGQAALTAEGFRTPDGRVAADRPADERTVVDLPAPQPFTESATSDSVLQRWASVTRSGRVEMLIDVSGSMNAVVPKQRKTRLAVALDAATRGLTLFEPSTSLGLWTFAARLDGDRDYRQVMPVTPIPQLVQGQTAQMLRSIRAVPGGHTGLYDSILALFEQARRSWAPGRLNVVVVITDGRNDDPGGIRASDLLTRLRAEADPRRPVTLVGVAIGPDGDTAELGQIARATGGRSFVVTDPSRIDTVLTVALGALAKT